MGDWFFCACGRARPSSTGFPSISASSRITTTTSSSSVYSPVLSCKNRFSVLSEESLCDDPLNVGFDDVPVAPRRKRHCISAAGISPIVPEPVNKDRPRRDSALTWRGRFSLRESHDLPYPLQRFTTIATSKFISDRRFLRGFGCYSRACMFLGAVWIP